MAVKTFTTGEVLTASDTNTYLNNGGLVYVSGGSHSSTSPLEVDGCWTAQFRNYRLVLTNVQVGSSSAVRLNFRASGATNNTNNYQYAFRGLRANGASGDTSSGGNLTFAEIGIFIDDTTDVFGAAIIDITQPQIAERTFGLCNSVGLESAYQFRQGGFVHNTTTQFDGFALSLSGGGNLTCNYDIYGYRVS